MKKSCLKFKKNTGKLQNFQQKIDKCYFTFLFKNKFQISRFNFIKNGNILAVSVVQNFEQIAKNLKNKNEILKKKS